MRVRAGLAEARGEVLGRERVVKIMGNSVLDRIYSRMRALNFMYCWCDETHDTLWPIANRHLRRMRLMYSKDALHWLDAKVEGYSRQQWVDLSAEYDRRTLSGT